MDIKEIEQIYSEMNIGSQEERDKYIAMSENMNKTDKNVYYFIQHLPISQNNSENNNA
jgi:hypothetical protein